MITYCKGNILEADVEAYVNPVNTVGVMGKGLALAFKSAYPHNFNEYSRACRRGRVRIGEMFISPTLKALNPRWIINFPTKEHWKDPSKLEWVVQGLDDLRLTTTRFRIESIAIPAVGCGLGGLDWKDVRPAIESAFKDVRGVDVQVYVPAEGGK